MNVTSFATRLLCVLTLLAICASVVPAASQTAGRAAGTAKTTATPPPPSTAAELRGLIETLENDERRKQFTDQLRTLLAAQETVERKQPPAGAGLIQSISTRVKLLSERFADRVRLVSELPDALARLARGFSAPDVRRAWIEGIWRIAAALAGALAAGQLARLFLRRPQRIIETRHSETRWARVPLLLTRTIMEVVPIIAFAAGGYAVLSATGTSQIPRIISVAVLNAIVVTQLALVLARACVTPRAAQLRVMALDDETANYAYLWARRFAVIGIYGYFAAQAWAALPLPRGGSDVISSALGMVVAALAVILVLQIRYRIKRQISVAPQAEIRGGLSLVRRRLGEIWHVLAIFYVIALYIVWEMQLPGGFAIIARGTAVALVVTYLAIVAARSANRLLERVLGVSDELQERYPGLKERADRYFHILRATVGTAIGISALVIVLEAWGVDAFDWLASDFGQRVIGTAVSIALLIALSVAFWELASGAIQRYLARASQDSGTVSARAQTLLPLLRNAILVTLVILFLLVTLSEFGINIGPLLAGAGVVGIAIGLGAQSLFKDIITGLFILTENQFAVGDVVRAGSHAGLVEGLTIRTLILRDLSGNVHIIPFGEVRTIENFTKEYSRYLLEVGVAYREDPDEVIELLIEIGDEMRRDAYYGPLMIEPIEILGVDRFADSAVIIRARLTTQPIKQWEVGREFNRRMKKKFDECGIEIPFPHRTLYFGEDKSGQAPVAHVRVAEDREAAADYAAEPAAEAVATERYRSRRRGAGGKDDSD